MVTVVIGLQLNELPLVHWDSLFPGWKKPWLSYLCRWLGGCFTPKPFEDDATFDEHIFQMGVEQTTKIG